MNTIKKTVIAVVILLAIFVIIVLWNSPIDSSNSKKEINTQTTITTTTETTTQTTAPSTTKPTTTESIALSFETSEEAKKYVEKYAKEKGYDIKAYPEKFFDLMVKDKKSIDFVLDYPAELEKEHSSKLELDNFDEVPHLLQWDKRWGYHKFKNGVVSVDGCGATCVSMIAIYYNHDVSLTPDVVADYTANNGYFVDGSGTSWSLFDKGIKHYGLKSSSFSSKKSLVKALENNHPVIVSVREGDFTRRGHYIVIVGYENDEFIVNDPYSIVNSEKRWSWERIQPQIKNMWEIYK